MGELRDRVADVADVGARPDRPDARIKALLGHFGQPPREHARLADQEHLAGVAVVAVLDDRDVDVHHVAGLQHLLGRRDAVADDVVDRRADRLRERRLIAPAPVVERRRDAVDLVDDVGMADPVEFLGGDAGLDVLPDHLEDAGGQATRHAHLGDLVGGLGPRRANAALGIRHRTASLRMTGGEVVGIHARLGRSDVCQHARRAKSSSMRESRSAGHAAGRGHAGYRGPVGVCSLRQWSEGDGAWRHWTA